MQEMLAPTTAIKAVGLDDKCALVTDGRFSGGTAGASIGHVSPEAAVGGPIGLLKNGDMIDIDIPSGVLSVRLSEQELADRRAAGLPRSPRSRRATSRATPRWPPARIPARSSSGIEALREDHQYGSDQERHDHGQSEPQRELRSYPDMRCRRDRVGIHGSKTTDAEASRHSASARRQRRSRPSGR